VPSIAAARYLQSWPPNGRRSGRFDADSYTFAYAGLALGRYRRREWVCQMVERGK
jgi:hypothetical protein